jgi:hypothetical protein
MKLRTIALLLLLTACPLTRTQEQPAPVVHEAPATLPVAAEEIKEQIPKDSATPTTVEQTLQPTAEASAQVHAQEQPVKPAPKKRTIKVKNGITDAMLRYSHWSGTYSPSMLRIKVNGKWIEPGQELNITLKDNTIQILYIFQFTVGTIVYHDNAQLITYAVEPDAESITLTIKWGEKPTSLQVSNARRVEIVHDYGKK